MKKSILSFLSFAIAMVSSVNVFAADVRRTLARPLIVGASISSGQLAVGPGTRLARRYGAGGNIQDSSRSGAYGKDLTGFTVGYARTRTIVIGVDLMFWDSTLDDIAPSLRQLKHNIAVAREAGVPFILGDVPPLNPWPYQQVSRDRINRAIYSLCKSSRGCYVLPLDRMYRSLQSKPIHYRDSDYDWPRFSSDGLHLNDDGSDYLADMIVSIIRRMP